MNRFFFLLLMCIECMSSQAQNISTGIDIFGNALGIGGTDPNWTIVASPLGAIPAIVCPSYTPYWQMTPIGATNARWINTDASYFNEIPGNYVYERDFVVAPGTSILNLNFGIAYDDFLVSAELVPPVGANIPLTFTPGSPNKYFISPFPTPAAITCPVAGTWKLRITVNYFDSVGGFMLSGNIAATQGSICQCPPVMCNPIVGISNSTPNCGQVCFAANMLTLCNNCIPTYSWNFGNGNTSSGQTPCETYTTNGTYPISVSVVCIDSCGNAYYATASTSVTITNAGLSSTFCATVTASSKTVTLNNVVTTGCVGTKTYKWVIKDALNTVIYTSPTPLTSPNINYTFLNPGLYTVCLVSKCTSTSTAGTAPSECCTECCKQIIIPTPCATLNPTFTYTIPVSGSNIIFNSATTAGSCITHNWTITPSSGPSLTSSVKTPTFSLVAGTYTVCHTVSCNQGANGGICTKKFCKTICISANPTCTANANFKYLSCGGLSATFSNLSSSASTYSWDFGDGSPISTLANPPAHSYPTAGDYMVCLTINAGTSCMASVCIKVKIAAITCQNAQCGAYNLRVQGQEEVVVASDEQMENLGENEQVEAAGKLNIEQSKLNLYPNPTTSILYLSANDNSLSAAKISVYDLQGELIYQKNCAEGIIETEIDLSTFANGLYIINLQGSYSPPQSYKIIKE